ncbi:MAG TPA: hypothetical protein VGQ69_09910 [Gemmatimonadales bacterium]|nr:hypothetical protein [Gemmatimonadales bacterium]
MNGDRREFLGTLLAAGALPLVGKSGGTVASSRPPDFWDLSWTSRLAGPHRAAFDWFQPNASAGLWRAGTWKRQVVEAFGVKPEEVSAVLVIRHSAIPMIMGDEFWLRHKLGKQRKIKDPMTNKVAERNPYRSFAKAAKPPAPEQDSSLEGFLKNGGIVLACGFAFGFLVSLEAKLQEKKASEVRSEVLQQVIPGIIIQPSGFFALIEAQRNGCGLFPAEGEV